MDTRLKQETVRLAGQLSDMKEVKIPLHDSNPKLYNEHCSTYFGLYRIYFSLIV
jgi:hypothetical protein